jgi:hypothetical protein
MDNKLSRACSANGRGEKWIQTVSWKLKGRDCLGNMSINGYRVQWWALMNLVINLWAP